MKRTYITLLFLAFTGLSDAQVSIRDSSITMHIVGIGYSVQLPAGDLADRFGWNSMLEGIYYHKLKTGYLVGLNGAFLFGNQVKENQMLKALQGEGGGILDNDGKFTDIRFFERGFHIAIAAGKLFTWGKPNANSGLMITAGPGLLQHKIRIETIGNNIPQLNKEYKKGYDRLTNGISLHETIGYYYFGNKHLVNFYLGFEFIQAFTENRRDYNYDEMKRDDSKRVDLLFGLRTGWMLPIYKRAPQKFYFY
ncbi:MAG: hypothetical protein LC117_03560 [Bacteroidia bacterium]|nr:hypothetical protein [Bacteroidia bacterium]MCZ2276990.1 hypothetical protein [Bacteroidia bacterium]